MQALAAKAWIWQSPPERAMLPPLISRVAGFGCDAPQPPIEQPADRDVGLPADLLDTITRAGRASRPALS